MAEQLGSILGRTFGEIATGQDHKDWSGGSRLLRARANEAIAHCSANVEDTFHYLKRFCESPIEVVALAALLALFPNATAVAQKVDLRNHPDWKVAIVPQMPMRGFRLDFGIITRATRAIHGLECDGRSYHLDRRADNERSVVLWKHGCLIYRVTGSELCRDPIDALKPFYMKVEEHGRTALV